QKYQVVWDIKNIDSSDLPGFLLLKGYRFEEGDTNRIPYRTQFIDSTTLFSLPYVWIGSPGYYWLEARDSLRKIHYSSDKIRIDLCALFQLPEHFQPGLGRYFKPLYSQNIQRIDLVIFDALGNEVFTSKNPQFRWDGRNQTSTEPCPPGSYFYHCDVWEYHGNEIRKKNLTGIIEINY
ncbi:MAG: gliding motility-associated C-terminal domain-containing protein, partial [Bacteroidota bacterium]|nr:gliding motility-associated C-terminal domain-containing protein [Bacteroidota bacterium]MDX5430243.1 gliding motility-associated C-terminal domain-containing protein [Bacteroidota bacterium]MDX5469004.1 gliding motility-associated C-terminal domain-containing protein [Bacteroidota bacterium]